MPVHSYLPGSIFTFGKEGTYVALSFHRTKSRHKVSCAHASNYRDGPMYNGPWAWFAHPYSG